MHGLKMLGRLAAVALALCAASASAVTYPGTTSTWWARYNGAADGDHVVLATGDYGSVSLPANKVGVTLEAGEGARPVFHGITANKVQRVTLRGLEVFYDGAGNAIAANGAAGLTLDGLDIHGPPGGRNGVGISLRDTTDVTVIGSKIHDIGAGVVHLNAQRTLIADTDIRDLRGDGITGTSAYVTVRKVRLTNFYPGAGDHPDAIQFWGETPGIVVEDNVFTRGVGQPVQGVFVERARDIIIRRNALVGTMYNGISLSVVVGGVVEDNLVAGWDDMPTRIITRDGSSGVTVRGNLTQAVVQYGAANPGYAEAGNTILPPAKVGDVTMLATWLKRGDPPAPPADPRDAAIAEMKRQLAEDAVAMAAAKAQAAKDAAALATMGSRVDALAVQLADASARADAAAGSASKMGVDLAAAQARAGAAEARVAAALAALN